MLFNEFLNTVEKYPNKLALNSWTYSELLDVIVNREHKNICESENEYILIDILNASRLNKPLIVLPKFNKNNVIIPIVEDTFSLYLYSSGSTGSKKSIKLTEKMIFSNFQNASDSQNLSSNDNILTVCSLNHTGGINAQSLPGLLVGSHVVVDNFNPYTILNKINQYNISVTHFVPIMIDALLKLKKIKNINNLRLAVAGSDCIKVEHAEFFLKNNIPFMVNYGLTQAGPIIINHTFTSVKELEIFNIGIPLGSKIYCDYQINNGELLLKGPCVSSNDWLQTDDCVRLYNSWFLYTGRISAGCKIIEKNYK
jgi:acyl-CoA synthetase (AMP-forming)/AMP-acid ligase II